MSLFKPGESGNPEGRPKGATNKTTLALREMMEADADALPVPVYLFRLGKRYEAEGDRDHAVPLMVQAMKMAYPQLKAVELSGEVTAVMPVIPIPGPPPLSDV